MNDFDPPSKPRRSTTLTSLTVAGFGFRTIGRLVATTSIIQSHFDPPPRSRLPFGPPSTSITTSLTVAGFGFRAIGRLVATTSIIQSHFDPPPRSRLPLDPPSTSITTSLTVAGFIASGQSADWCNHFNHFDHTPLETPVDQQHSPLQDNRQTGDNHFGHPPPPSIPHRFNYFNHNQSDRGGLWLQDNRQTGDNHFEYNPLHHPPRFLRRSTTLTHQSDRGGLRLQDNRQTGDNNFDPPSHLDPPPRSPNSIPTSLAVAGSGFRTIGRLVQPLRIPPSMNDLDPPSKPRRSTTLTSLTVAGSGFRTIGRLVTTTSILHPTSIIHPSLILHDPHILIDHPIQPQPV
ncbi:hypothetical protein N7516_002940 [Penicillium verrucosum]|uniref:uncharacterized protein n=1 Tax=Penicillium verrucosum TaxID=60171 RepID=UPI002544F652|nr:uncharacterized protein N7516_002940 [Penicillium verrucosum]KAJ5942772.1 hypothetical protein N7516_002940 [Penicillium verrucosum]